MDPISEVAFSTLPQAVKNWIAELGWKREDILIYHVQHSSPKVVTITNTKQESHTARFAILKSGMWKKKA